MCDAHIRPFLPLNDTRVDCKLNDNKHFKHTADLRDYAYPGSLAELSWMENDRRTYHGEWPGQCLGSPACNLPNGHPGGCNVH